MFFKLPGRAALENVPLSISVRISGLLEAAFADLTPGVDSETLLERSPLKPATSINLRLCRLPSVCSLSVADPGTKRRSLDVLSCFF